MQTRSRKRSSSVNPWYPLQTWFASWVSTVKAIIGECMVIECSISMHLQGQVKDQGRERCDAKRWNGNATMQQEKMKRTGTEKPPATSCHTKHVSRISSISVCSSRSSSVSRQSKSWILLIKARYGIASDEPSLVESHGSFVQASGLVKSKNECNEMENECTNGHQNSGLKVHWVKMILIWF